MKTNKYKLTNKSMLKIWKTLGLTPKKHLFYVTTLLFLVSTCEGCSKKEYSLNLHVSVPIKELKVYIVEDKELINHFAGIMCYLLEQRFYLPFFTWVAEFHYFSFIYTPISTFFGQSRSVFFLTIIQWLLKRLVVHNFQHLVINNQINCI